MFSSLTMVVPFLTAVFSGMGAAARYLFAAGFSLVAGALLRFLRIEPGRLNRQQALAVTGFSWIVLALFASIPLYFSGHYGSYLDALFDGVSGLTTTGARSSSISITCRTPTTCSVSWSTSSAVSASSSWLFPSGCSGNVPARRCSPRRAETSTWSLTSFRPRSSSPASPPSLSSRRRASLPFCACLPAWSPCARSSIRFGYPFRDSSPAVSRR